ncbi:MAG: hypothetical protein HQM08_01325 [Candidatus Riflebacteria bacterium]|nr:hypothetical protein [Candidatus Riflebacteria bacterium]
MTIAESAVSEGVTNIREDLKADHSLQEAIADYYKSGKPEMALDFSLAKLPVTSEAASALFGEGKARIEGKILLHSLQRTFPSEKLGNERLENLRFDGEFQGILRFDFSVIFPSEKQEKKDTVVKVPKINHA